MQFETKIALVIHHDLAVWQKLNIAAFLTSGIAAAFPECVGEPYRDLGGNLYHALIGQPILIYGGDGPALARALDRAMKREVRAAIYTRDMFTTTHDAANRAAVEALPRERLELVGIGLRAERKLVD